MTAVASSGSFLETLLSGAQASTTGWLVGEYAALQAAPQKLAALKNAAAALASKVSLSPGADQTTVAAAPMQIATLTAQYPSMITAVNAIYPDVQAIQHGAPLADTIADAGSIANAIVMAQQFSQGVSDVETSLIAVIDHLLASGAVTPSEAQALYSTSQSSDSGWLKYSLYAIGGYVLYRVVKGVL